MHSLASRIWALLGVLFVLGYFAIAAPLTLEYVDEGQILYPSWVTSLGAVPYREFGHMYGPALFTLNGALFRLFGTDLLVVRVSLAVLKTALIVLVYLLSRHVASRTAALVVCAVLVAVWGAPVWVFNTPYANHYSLTLNLAGMLVFLSLRRNFRVACLIAGLCFGLAATFKQTGGFFGFSGLALFLILAREEVAERSLASRPAFPDWLVRSARLTVLAVLFGIVASYLGRRNTLWNAAILATPFAILLAIATTREMRAPVDRGAREGLHGIVVMALGAAIPTFGVGAYYAAKGLLPDLVFYLVYGLPQKVIVFEPLPFPGPRGWLLIAIPAAMLAAAILPRVPGRGRVPIVAGLGILAIAAYFLVADPTAALAYVRDRAWHGIVLNAWFVLPLLGVWLTGFSLPRETRARGALLLLLCNAAVALVMWYPVADAAHVIMGLPAFAPLWAFLGDRFHAGAAARQGRGATASRLAAAGLIAGMALCLAAPSIDLLAQTVVARPPGPPGGAPTLERATAIRGAPPKFGKVVALADYLEREFPADKKLLVLGGEQILYLLTERRSALERHEFLFYLVGTGMLPRNDALDVLSERDAIAQLSASQPIIVGGGHPQFDERLRGVFKELSDYLDANYQQVATVGPYRISTWKDGARAP